MSSSYFQEGPDNKYKVSGMSFSGTYFTKNSGALSGYGFVFSDYKAKGKSISNTFMYPENFNFKLYQINSVIYALTFGHFRFEFDGALTYLLDESDINNNDVKYGYGLGLKAHYNLYHGLTLGLGYEQIYFDYGKNASTGKTGSLANKIMLKDIKMMLSYVMFFGGGGSGDASADSSSSADEAPSSATDTSASDAE